MEKYFIPCWLKNKSIEFIKRPLNLFWNISLQIWFSIRDVNISSLLFLSCHLISYFYFKNQVRLCFDFYIHTTILSFLNIGVLVLFRHSFGMLLCYIIFWTICVSCCIRLSPSYFGSSFGILSYPGFCWLYVPFFIFV